MQNVKHLEKLFLSLLTRREKPRKQGGILHLLLKSDKDLTPSYGSFAYK